MVFLTLSETFYLYGASHIVERAHRVSSITEDLLLHLPGFGICGIPETLLDTLAATRVRDLTVVSCTAGMSDTGIGQLVTAGVVKRLVSSYIGENNVVLDKFFNGELEVELVPQGTLAERIRAAGAGIPAFYTPTGYKTMVHEGGLPMAFKDGGKTVTMISLPKEVRSPIHFYRRIILSFLYYSDEIYFPICRLESSTAEAMF